MTEQLKRLNKDITPIDRWLPHDRVPWVIAGPCSAESAEQMLSTARGLVKSPHVKAFRAGIWKPRTRPNSFEGIGEAGLDWLSRVKAETGLLTATEVANKTHVELCIEHGVDILWVGARTTVSPFAVQEIADALRGTDIPVFVKNPINPELGLWLGAIERLYDAGIRKLGAIHRGFSTYVEMQFRNDPKWQIPIELKRLLPDLPLICDPSHISGSRAFIEPLSQMAMDIGIQGLIIESHIDPDRALSDAKQQVTPEELCRILDRLKARDSTITDRDVKRQIGRLRAEISQVDARIIQDLAERMKWVEEIGRLKHEHSIPVLQITRWDNLLEEHLARAQKAGLDPEFIKALFELIHAQAVKRQLQDSP
ncbi:MAG TPA: chorismate mutase [Sedimentisphaerales bacterium]|jgi:chorismate mutase|nr:chorismate mutase [Sedimentisphaerales bacterium]HNU29979.1 chorismate mutase [Sedimentisphaerales bacterium]